MEILIEPAALLLGWLANMLRQLSSASSSAGGPVNPLRWARKRPYKVALGVVGALAGYIALASTGQLNAVAAFAAGYLGQDAIDAITSAARNRFVRAGKQ